MRGPYSSKRKNGESVSCGGTLLCIARKISPDLAPTKEQWMVAWILSLMVALQPNAPWKESYERTAQSVADVVAAEEPLFSGPQGREKGAAILVALAWAESRFDPKAVGDQGRSVGLYQIFGPNLPTPEGFGRKDILGNPLNATKVALRMIRASMAVCAKFPLLERLGWYAAGDCQRGAGASRFRVGLAMKVMQSHPVPKEQPKDQAPAPESPKEAAKPTEEKKSAKNE
jgi:Transglycosylase SLT domain